MNITRLKEIEIMRLGLKIRFTWNYLVEYRLDKSFENLFDSNKWASKSLRSIEYTFFF
jgi:hypothetical protein